MEGNKFYSFCRVCNIDTCVVYWPVWAAAWAGSRRRRTRSSASTRPTRRTRSPPRSPRLRLCHTEQCHLQTLYKIFWNTNSASSSSEHGPASAHSPADAVDPPNSGRLLHKVVLRASCCLPRSVKRVECMCSVLTADGVGQRRRGGGSSRADGRRRAAAACNHNVKC